MHLPRVSSPRSLEDAAYQTGRICDTLERWLTNRVVTIKPTTSISEGGEFNNELVYIEPDGNRVRWYRRLIGTDGFTTWREVAHQHPETGSITVAGTGTVTNTTTETTLILTNEGALTIPASFLVPGRTLRVRAKGYFSTNNPAVTLTLEVKLGSLTVCTSGAQTPTASLASRYWELDTDITCRVKGASGTLFGQGAFKYMAAATGAPTWWEMRNTAVGSLDTTFSHPFDITATWGVGVAAADTISMTNLIVDIIN